MTDYADLQRTELVNEKARSWGDELTDLSGGNRLLNFVNRKTTCLPLDECDAAARTGLFDTKTTRLRALFPEDHRDATERARKLHRAIRTFSEEQGVDVGKLVHGLVRAPESEQRGTGAPLTLRAPLLLRPLAIEPRTAAESDFTLQVVDGPELNQVLLHALERLYGVELDVDELTGKVDGQLAELTDPQTQLRTVFGELETIARGQGVTLRLEESVAVGVLSYQKLPMVRDLETAGELLVEHDVVAALAGHRPAMDAIREADAGHPPAETDALTPEKEHLVQDTDGSQHWAVNAALAGRHTVIEGPPGTGKSQTIANVIAGASARGKRVLFVAEKRAAIEAVTARLADVGLENLVLDLHRTRDGRRHVADQLDKSFARDMQGPVDDAPSVHRKLADLRERLVTHTTQLHTPREPWGLSVYQVRDQLLRMGDEHATQCAFRGGRLDALNRDVAPMVEKELYEFVADGGVRLLRAETPWCQADVRTTDDARRILAELDKVGATALRRNSDHMRQLCARAGLLLPDDLAGRTETLRLLDEVSTSVDAFGQEVFSDELDELFFATAPRRVRARCPHRLTLRRRRGLLRQARRMSRKGVTRKAALHAELARAVQQRDHWRRLSGDARSQPSRVTGLEEVTRQYTELRLALTTVATCANLEVEHRPTSEVESSMEELRRDTEMLARLPGLIEKRERFQNMGLEDLLAEVAGRNATAEQAQKMFRHSWLCSLDTELRLTSRAIAHFSEEQQSRVAAEFRTSDVEHQKLAARRVRRHIAIAARKARDRYPDEMSLVRREANKKSRHLPVRRLVERAPNVPFSLRPCWAMSPLMVSQSLPQRRLFDLVIFDEASQIKPQDAITSIMRGDQLVVVGDDKQLPPSRWFERWLAEDDEPDDDQGELKDYESILASVRGILPHSHCLRLRWHYRSLDERLIAFSNREFYGNDLVTFPGTARDSPMRLEVVDGTASPGQGGSSPEETRRVVDLVLEHARQRPDESLGVITLGDRHRARVEHALRDALQGMAAPNDFFAENAGPTRRFFVKNIETVQGDERDAIILSLGVARRADGSISRKGFGPLNWSGGERRLNVAVTRARRRMTVVSSFSPGMLTPTDKITGTELLRRYLETAERGGDAEAVGRMVDADLNGFEEDVRRRLSAQGIMVYPQWGFSGYRIDFALAHPKDPGRMVLAVETDGDSYHRMTSVRDRDRLRQEHLQRLGWRFHRIWASAWFDNPEDETHRVVAAWHAAVAGSTGTTVDSHWSQATGPRDGRGDTGDDGTDPRKDAGAARTTGYGRQRGSRPSVRSGLKIDEYTDVELLDLCRWLVGDGLQRDRHDRVDEAMRELGFRRRGRRIVERLESAAAQAQHEADLEET